MEYDDQVTPGHFSRHLIPLAKILVKKMAERTDNSKCWAGLYYDDIQPLTYHPKPAIMPWIERYMTPKPVNQVTIED